eukprot:SAG11_NODE_2360_length_3462_cov_2.125186_2_plen_736_part_00
MATAIEVADPPKLSFYQKACENPDCGSTCASRAAQCKACGNVFNKYRAKDLPRLRSEAVVPAPRHARRIPDLISPPARMTAPTRIRSTVKRLDPSFPKAEPIGGRAKAVDFEKHAGVFDMLMQAPSLPVVEPAESKPEESKASKHARHAATTRWEAVRAKNSEPEVSLGATPAALTALVDTSTDDGCLVGSDVTLSTGQDLATESLLASLSTAQSSRSPGKIRRGKRQHYTLAELKFGCYLRSTCRVKEAEYKELYKLNKVRVPISSINRYLYGERRKGGDADEWKVVPGSWKTLKHLSHLGKPGDTIISRNEEKFMMAAVTLAFLRNRPFTTNDIKAWALRVAVQKGLRSNHDDLKSWCDGFYARAERDGYPLMTMETQQRSQARTNISIAEFKGFIKLINDFLLVKPCVRMQGLKATGNWDEWRLDLNKVLQGHVVAPNGACCRPTPPAAPTSHRPAPTRSNPHRHRTVPHRPAPAAPSSHRPAPSRTVPHRPAPSRTRRTDIAPSRTEPISHQLGSDARYIVLGEQCPHITVLSGFVGYKKKTTSEKKYLDDFTAASKRCLNCLTDEAMDAWIEDVGGIGGFPLIPADFWDDDEFYVLPSLVIFQGETGADPAWMQLVENKNKTVVCCTSTGYINGHFKHLWYKHCKAQPSCPYGKRPLIPQVSCNITLRSYFSPSVLPHRNRTVPHRPAPSRTVPHPPHRHRRPAPSRTVPHRPAPAAPTRTVPHRLTFTL